MAVAREGSEACEAANQQADFVVHIMPADLHRMLEIRGRRLLRAVPTRECSMPDFDEFVVVDADFLKRSRWNDTAIAALRAGEAEGLRTGASTLDGRLVLIGLMADNTNLAAETVRHLAETPERIRFAARAVVQDPPFRDQPQPISDARLPIAEEVRQLCRLAVDEAARLAAKTVGPEHLLLAMTRTDEHSAAVLLKQAGINLDRARRALRIVIGWPA